MGFADLGDVQLVYTDEGTGDPPMLFVHGYTCDSHDWSWRLPHFAAEHRVIALDLRGHGRSSTLESGYEPPVFAADVARLVEHLGCSPVVAVWHSMGALVVSALAVEHPEMVRALVAVDPGYLVADATVDGIPALKAAVEASDPVPFVQGLLGGTDIRASVPALRAWHLRRVAGLPAHVLRDTLTNISAGGEVTAMRSGGEGYLRCEAARCCRSTPAPRARPGDGAVCRCPLQGRLVGGLWPLAAPGTPRRVQRARGHLAGVHRLILGVVRRGADVVTDVVASCSAVGSFLHRPGLPLAPGARDTS